MVTKVTSKVLGNDIADVNLADNSVGNTEIKNNSITVNHILPLQITTDRLVDWSVTEPKIKPDTIYSVHMKAGGVIADNIGTGAVTEIKILAEAVTQNKIAPNAVITDKLAAGAVTTAKIGDRQVTRIKIGLNAVGADEIQNNAVSLIKLAKGAQGAIPVANVDGDLAYLSPGAENAVMAIRNGVPFWSSQVFISGMMMDYVGLTAPTGWVMANGMSIGDATSGANGRSNADCEYLFTMLWEAFPNDILAVSGGRGANAAADWAAHKSIVLPDLRGRVTVGRDEMGYSAAGRVTGLDDPDQIGSSGGVDKNTLGTEHLPPHRHWGFNTLDLLGSNGHPDITPYTYAARAAGAETLRYAIRTNAGTQQEPTTSLSSLPVVNGSVQTSMTANPIDNMQPFMLMTKIIKL